MIDKIYKLYQNPDHRQIAYLTWLELGGDVENLRREISRRISQLYTPQIALFPDIENFAPPEDAESDFDISDIPEIELLNFRNLMSRLPMRCPRNPRELQILKKLRTLDYFKMDFSTIVKDVYVVNYLLYIGYTPASLQMNVARETVRDRVFSYKRKLVPVDPIYKLIHYIQSHTIYNDRKDRGIFK